MTEHQFNVGDRVRLNAEGRKVHDSEPPELYDAVVVTEVRRNSSGWYVMWTRPDCYGCYEKYLEVAEGPW